MRIRTGRTGDLGWMLHRQAVVYAEEFGYHPVFEAYVARGIPAFLDNFDKARDGVWVAEDQAGQPLGFIGVQHDPEREGWAKLRWFLVEAEARGMGTGRRLMDEALGFVRKAGYKGVYLWTVDDLAAARRVYERAGFQLAYQDPHPCAWAPWGHEQRWELVL